MCGLCAFAIRSLPSHLASVPPLLLEIVLKMAFLLFICIEIINYASLKAQSGYHIPKIILHLNSKENNMPFEKHTHSYPSKVRMPGCCMCVGRIKKVS